VREGLEVSWRDEAKKRTVTEIEVDMGRGVLAASERK
jgi:hypothetical protein